MSEAINSMCRWYSHARRCYAYLSDVKVPKRDDSVSRRRDKLIKRLRESRWFTRGWTLQELIGPWKMTFFDQDWQRIANKTELASELNSITGIDAAVLEDRTRLPFISVAQRMSWAAMRSTARPEDQAHCLLGLFNVNIPLIYGEGMKAFQRLQEEIIRSSMLADHSILAWAPWTGTPVVDGAPPPSINRPWTYRTLLSPSPYGFRHAHDVVSWPLPQLEEFELLNRGLRITAYVSPVLPKSTGGNSQGLFSIALNAQFKHLPRT